MSSDLIALFTSSTAQLQVRRPWQMQPERLCRMRLAGHAGQVG
jgi:hypothetical protein